MLFERAKSIGKTRRAYAIRRYFHRLMSLWRPNGLKARPPEGAMAANSRTFHRGKYTSSRMCSGSDRRLSIGQRYPGEHWKDEVKFRDEFESSFAGNFQCLSRLFANKKTVSFEN